MADTVIVLQNNVTVVAGGDYSGLATFHNGGTARDCRVGLRWYDGTDSLLSTDWGALVNNSVDVQALVQSTAPPGVSYVHLVAEIQNVVYAEVHYIDQAGILTGTTSSWVPAGGDSASADGFIIERRVNNTEWEEVRGATRDDPYPFSPSDPVANIDDYEVPLNIGVEYRAFLLNNYVFSDSSDIVSTELPGTEFWLKAPEDPTLNTNIFVEMKSLTISSPKDIGVFSALGRRTPIVVEDVIKSDRMQLDLGGITEEELNAIEALWESQRTLLLQSPMQGRQWYVAIDTDKVLNIFNMTNPHTATQLNMVEVDKP